MFAPFGARAANLFLRKLFLFGGGKLRLLAREQEAAVILKIAFERRDRAVRHQQQAFPRGFDQAAVLDGGFAKWRAEGRLIEQAVRAHAPGSLSLTVRHDHWADKAAVMAAIGDGAVCTINALPAGVHSGETPAGYPRPGHIAGSSNVPYSLFLNEDGTFRDTVVYSVLAGEWPAVKAALASRTGWPRGTGRAARGGRGRRRRRAPPRRGRPPFLLPGW